MSLDKFFLAIAFAACGSACSTEETSTPEGPPAPSTVPATATGLGDLGRASGIDSLTTEQLSVSVHGMALYPSRGKILGRMRGQMTNNTGHILTSGELKLRFTVDFVDSCPYELQGSKKLSALGVSNSKPWHPGDTRDFLITTDNGLPEITGDFESASASASLMVTVKDPICYEARGLVAELPASWSSAVAGSPAGGKALSTRRLSVLSAADGGTRLETVEEDVTLTVIQAKGKKLRVRSPGGTEGWIDGDHVDVLEASLLFP